MKIKAWGTRGSIAVSNHESVNAGGNTTCYEVMSSCFPSNIRVMIDSGTGFVPAGWHYMTVPNAASIKYYIFYTHWHWDHILGLTLSPPTFINKIPMYLFGPHDSGVGPKDMVQYIFKRPFFPVDSGKFIHKMSFKTLYDYDVHVIVAHPEGGFTTLKLERFNTLCSAKKQMPIGGKNYPLDECMVIRMAQTNHGNSNCISYRFEEMPTGKVFVFCTDHEDLAFPSMDFKRHLSNADLVIMDAQYTDAQYHDEVFCTAGFGHGTPFGIVKHGLICNVKRLGITHHNPQSTDKFLESSILPEAVKAIKTIKSQTNLVKKPDKVVLTDKDIFLCYDYAEYSV